MFERVCECSLYNIKKRENENEEEYIWRLGQAKDSGLLDMSWDEIADVLNKELGNEDKPYSEAAYRKPYQQAKRFFESGVFCTDKEQQKQIRKDIQELKKQQIKTRDERTDLNRSLREQARKESYRDMVKELISECVEPIEISVGKSNTFESDNDLLVHISDIHTGIKIDNFCNTFDGDILIERMEKYVQEIIRIKNIHKSQNCYVVIGEILSGLIHNNLRLQNNMDLIEQFKFVSELLSVVLQKLSEEFKVVNVYVTAGNHSRVQAKKEDSLDGENMDILLPFYLKARLQNIENVVINDNKVESEIAMFSIRGSKVFSSHGHKDNPKDVVQKWTMMFGIKPDIVLLGHRHTNGLSTVYDTKVIQSGCCSGTDDYAMGIRKCNKAEQTVSVINDNGLLCVYDIQLQ